MSYYFVNKSLSLLFISSIYAFLHYTASMFMARDFIAILNHFIKNEIVERTFECVKRFLDHMISIDVLYKFSNVAFEHIYHHVHVMS